MGFAVFSGLIAKSFTGFYSAWKFKRLTCRNNKVAPIAESQPNLPKMNHSQDINWMAYKIKEEWRVGIRSYNEPKQKKRQQYITTNSNYLIRKYKLFKYNDDEKR